MISKSLKFWHNWFHRKEEQPELPPQDVATAAERRHPSAITVRAALRQKQKLNKAVTQ